MTAAGAAPILFAEPENRGAALSAFETLAERKHARVEEIRAGVAVLRGLLADYGAAHGGRFWLYGSAVTDRLRFDSDVDLLVDFPQEQATQAVDFVEAECARLRLEADVQSKAWCKEGFLKRVAATAVVIP